MKPTKVTDTELALLNELWSSGQATIRELTDKIYTDGTDAQYATVQKLLERLETKGLVIRDRTQRAHKFRPAIQKDDFIGSKLQALADQLCEGSITPLLTNLVQTRTLSVKDLKELKALVNALSQKRKARLTDD